MSLDVERAVYTATYYRSEFDSSNRAACKIVPMVKQLMPSLDSVLDIGCGVGAFLEHFIQCGIRRVCGVDGDYVPVESRRISAECFHEHDLKLPLRLDSRFDLVVSLEVAEHLSASYADIFVDSICYHADVVLFSAAVPGQTGELHVNEQPYAYWAEKFSRRGYDCFDCIRPWIMTEDGVDSWYKNNTFVYATSKASQKYPRLMSSDPMLRID